jgi:hypothetical protein
VVKQHCLPPHMYGRNIPLAATPVSESAIVCCTPPACSHPGKSGRPPATTFVQPNGTISQPVLRLSYCIYMMPCMLFTHAMVAFVTCTINGAKLCRTQNTFSFISCRCSSHNLAINTTAITA